MTDQTWNLLLRDQLAWPLTGQLPVRAGGELHLRSHRQARREAS